MSRPRSLSLSKGTLHRRLTRARPLTYHVVVAGAAGVGKTTLVARLLAQPPASVYLPTTEDLYVKTLELDGSDRCHAQIYDTAGNPKVLDMFCKSYREKGDVFVLLYSATDAGSLESLKAIIHTLQLPLCADSDTAGNDGGAIVVVVATKQDLLAGGWARSCTDEGEALAAQLGCGHVTISAKHCADEEVLALFQHTVGMCHQRAVATSVGLNNCVESVGGSERRASSASTETNETRPAARSHSLSDISVGGATRRQHQRKNSLSNLSALLSFGDRAPVIEAYEPPALEGCFLTLDLAGGPIERQDPPEHVNPSPSAPEDVSLCAVASKGSCGADGVPCKRRPCECGNANIDESASSASPHTNRQQSSSRLMQAGCTGQGSPGAAENGDGNEDTGGDTCAMEHCVSPFDGVTNTRQSRRTSFLQTLTRRRKDSTDTDRQSRPSQNSLPDPTQLNALESEQAQEHPLTTDMAVNVGADMSQAQLSASPERPRSMLFGRRNSESTVTSQSPRAQLRTRKASAVDRQAGAIAEVQSSDTRPVNPQTDTQQTTVDTAATPPAHESGGNGFRARLATMLTSPFTRRKTSRTDSGSMSQVEASGTTQLQGEGGSSPEISPSTSPHLARAAPRLPLSRQRLSTLGKYLFNFTSTVHAAAPEEEEAAGPAPVC